jgi:predicted permease
MFRNYLKCAWRNLTRNKGYSFINIFGLAIGMAVCILILLWVQDEVGYDGFHKNISRLYLVATRHDHGDSTGLSSGAPPAVAPALKREYGEIVNSCRYHPAYYEFLVRSGDKVFTEHSACSDPEFFQMFSLPFVEGDARSPFKSSHSIVLTEKMARKYFGNSPALGKMLTLNNRYGFSVSGVIKDLPRNSTFQFDMVFPMGFLPEYRRPHILDTWYNCSFYNFVELADKTSAHELTEKIAGRIKQSRPEEKITLFLSPFEDLHLQGIAGRGGHIHQVRIFSIIAFLILLIACINFMNLSTARSAKRSREVGIRKVVGASRRNLIRQFFGESFLFAFISLLVSLILVELMLPLFNSLAGKQLDLNLFPGNPILLWLLAIILITGLIAGSYPALLLSSFRPITVLRGTLKSGGSGALFRRILVIFQFAVSISLIIGTLIVIAQLGFIKQKDLGLKKEQILYLRLKGALRENYTVLKHELLSHPGISRITLTSNLPTGIYQNGDGWQWDGKAPSLNPLVTYLSADHDFLNTYSMELLEGQFFRDTSPKKTDRVVINRHFARLLGKGPAVGKQLLSKNSDTGETISLTVMGVVKDFHFKPLDREMGAIIIFNENSWWTNIQYMSIKVQTKAISGAIAYIGQTVKRLNPEFPFEYRFLDEDYGTLYSSYERVGKIFNHFAVLAILVSCLGLFGLASFTAEQKTKEIGIRKALGASVSSVVGLFSKSFAKWVLISNFIAWPASYLFMKNWLDNFAYRTSLNIGIFMISGLLALAIAMVTVSVQSIKAATANPVEALRHE